MRNFLFLLILPLLITTGIAQNRHIIKAVVIDSAHQQPLELATVALLKAKDSSLISYTLTDKNGAFTLRNVKDDEPMRLLISYVGYQSLRINLKFRKDEMLDLGNLYLSSKILNEVVIKGERVPIIIKKDTIEFNAEAFKVRPNAVVEDLLKKLPGIQVDHDGKITVNGKDISKIKIDGKNFFASDPTIASRNLDADMISKVQVYDDREDDPDHLVPDYKVKKIINLKFKKALKKTTFGKVYGSGGTQDRYQAGAMYNKFVDELQVSVLANSNNLSGTGIFGDGSGGFGPSSGLQQSTTGGANINNSFGKKVKVNLSYNFSDSKFNNNSNSNRQQFLNDTTLTNNTNNFNHNDSGTQSVAGTVDWAIDTVSKVHFVPHFAYNYSQSNSSSNGISFNNFIPLLNSSVNSNNSHNNGTSYEHTLNYYHSYKKKGESLSLSNTISITPHTGISYTANDLKSYTVGLNSDTLRRLADNTSSQTSVNLNVGYHYPVTKSTIAGVTVTDRYNKNGADLFTYDQDPKTGLYNIFLQDQSSVLTRIQWEQSIKPDITYRKKNIMLQVALLTTLQHIDNQFTNHVADLNQHFLYFLPNASFQWNKVTFNYNDDVRQPSINDLQPITIIYNQLSSFKGNPDLKPTRLHSFSINYFNFNMESMVNTFLTTSFVLESNSITRERFVTAQGAELTTPINRNGRFTVYANGSIGKRFKKHGKWQIRENTNFNASMGRNFFEVNHQDGYQDTYALPLTQQLAVNWNDIIDVGPSYNVIPSFTKYEKVSYSSVNYVQQKLTVPLDILWPKRTSINMNYSYSYNPLVAQGFQRHSNLLSLSVARFLQAKDKGEFRLTCYDLLNQSVSAYHYSTENTVNDIQNQSLKRYFLLTYTYKFNKTITK